MPPSSPEEPPALSGSGAEEPAEPVYYDADFYARPEWNAAGTGTAIKNGAALTWVGLDNEVLRTAAFGDPAAGPGLSPEDITLTESARAGCCAPSPAPARRCGRGSGRF